MAGKSTDFNVRFLADTTKGVSDVNRFGGALEHLGDIGAGSLAKVGAIAGAVGGAVAVVADRVLSSIISLGSEAVEASDATDKFKSTLNFAGIGAPEIEDLTKKTRAYADATVYDLATIQNTTAQLAANSVPNYEALTEAAGNLNAVAGGNADTFRSVGMVLTQTAGQGKLTTENWNQLSDAIPGASGKLQEALLAAGAYTGNFRDAMEKGEITADEFNAAIMELGTQPVAVEAAKSTTTFEGAIGSLQATIVGGLSDALTSLKPMLTGAINGLSSTLGGFFTWFGDAYNGTVALLGAGDFTSAFKRAFHVTEDDSVVGFLLTLREKIMSLFEGDTFAPIMAALAPIGSAIAGTFGPVLEQLLDTVAPVGAAIAGVFAQIGPVLGQLIPIILNMAASFSPTLMILQALLPILPPLISAFGGLASQVLSAVVPILSSLSGVMQTLMAALMPVVTTLIDALLPIFNAIVPVIGAVLSAVAPLISALVDALAPILTVVAQILGAVLKPVLDIVVVAVNALAAVITWLVQNVVIPMIQGLLVPIIKTLGDVITNVFKFAGDIISGFFDGLASAFKGTINFVIDLINGFIGGLNAVGGMLKDATGGAIGFSIGTIPRLATGTVTSGPMVALIGDNPGGREVVAPYDSYVDEIRRAAGVGAAAGTNGGGAVRLAREDLDYLAEKLSGDLFESIRLGSKRAVTSALRR